MRPLRLGLMFGMLSCATLDGARAACQRSYDACVNACPGVAAGTELLSPGARPGASEPQPSTQSWRADRNESPVVDCVYACRARLCD